MGRGLLGVAAVLACSARPAEAPSSATTAPLDYIFESPDGDVSLADLRGRATAILFITTYDLRSQLMAQRLDETLRRVQRRANALAVVVEAPRYSVLIPTFSESLELHYRVLLANHEVLVGGSLWGSMQQLPQLVVLDARGRLRHRYVGEVAADELKRTLDAAAASAAAP